MLTKLETLSSPSSLSFPVGRTQTQTREPSTASRTTKGAPFSPFSRPVQSNQNCLLHYQQTRTKTEREEVDVSKLCLNSNYLDFVEVKKLLSELSTLGIGGPCKYFVQVFNSSQLRLLDTIYTVEIVTIDGDIKHCIEMISALLLRDHPFLKDGRHGEGIVAVTFQLKPSASASGTANKHTCKGEALNFNVWLSSYPLPSGIDCLSVEWV
ncbi:hypothetical protein NE237_023159 [Protea cynaroides]|uniref:Uncharacterized protein n=1 Tax=Protea cynaroides TaxID=273540 RepID=A0A9Q0HEJ0_9MAGN|nr:hypothetical protein NE237_023159 [Protea cynaroides]